MTRAGRFAAVLFALLAACRPALAKDAPACADEPTTPAVAACLQRQLAVQDAALAQAVQRLLDTWRVRDEREVVLRVAPALAASQAAWEAYRARECAAQALAYGAGTGAGAAELRCRLALTAQRRDALARDW